MRDVHTMRLLLCLLMAPLMLPAAESPPTKLDDLVQTRLVEIPYDTIRLSGRDNAVLVEILEQVEGDHLTYERKDSGIRVTVPWANVLEVIPQRSASEVAGQRCAELMQALDYDYLRSPAESDIVRTLRWARERDAAAVCLPALLKAFQGNPRNAIVLEALVDELVASREVATLETVLRVALGVKPTWRRGYQVLATILQDQDRQGELMTLVTDWLDRLPTSEMANRLQAQAAQAAGDLARAQESYRKLYAHHDDDAAGVQYILLSLQLDDVEDARECADEILARQPDQPGLRAAAACVYLAQGHSQTARLLLGQAGPGGPPELQEISDYNRAWLAWEAGEAGTAERQWSAIDHPAAHYALARLARQTITDPAVLAHPQLGPRARELNASLALEREDPAAALRLLGDGLSDRLLLLKRIAAMQVADYSRTSIEALSAHEQRDAYLWRAYGLIRQGDFAASTAALAHLPENDGMAAVYRLFCAEAQGDAEAAARWFRVAGESAQAPRAYLDHLTAFYYRSQNDTELVENFDWVAGELLPLGWFSQAAGTNIIIRANGDQLTMSGTQTASPEPVSRVWRVLPRAHVRRVQVRLTAAIPEGAGGLELLDEARANGLAVGIVNNQRLAWRRCRDGRWGAWEALLDSAPPVIALWLDDQQQGTRQIQVMTETDRVPLTSLLDLPGEMIGIGFFTEAVAGSPVDLQLAELRIQLHGEGPR